jgi:hypothetical protein
MAPHGFRRDGLFIALALLLVAWYAGTTGGGFPLDDSWIHQTYGRNLAERGEWAFIPGQPSAASTSPLYTVLLALGYRLGAPPELWAHVLGVLALAVGAGFAARLGDRALPGRRVAGLVCGLAVLFTWHLAWGAAAGMETMLFSALTLAVIWLAWREADAHNFVLPALTGRRAAWRGLIFGVAAALTTLARPEGVLLAGLAGLALLILWPRGLIAWIIGAAFGFSATLAPYLLLNFQLTGGPLPDTAAAKFIQHAVLLQLPYTTRLRQMATAILVGGQFLLIPGILFYVWHVLRGARADFAHDRAWVLKLLLLIWPAALIALYAARLPASYQHGRYVIPALPALVVAGAVGTLLLIEAGRRTLLGRTATRALAIAAALLMLTFTLLMGADAYRRDVRIINEEMVASAVYIRDNLPLDELLAIHDIGAVGYFAARPMLDIAGLVSPEIIPLIPYPEQIWETMRARDARYLLAFPDQVPGDDAGDPRLCPLWTTGGPTAQAVAGYNMTLYRLAWDGACAG